MKLINPLPSDVSYLYHYTTTDTALNYILKNGTLKFNSFSQVNDPRECKAWDVSPFIRAGLDLSLEQYKALSSEVSDILKANAKLICFSRDKDEAIGKWQPEALFERGFSKPSMWHHYAGKHDGICLMFDRDKLNKEFLKRFGKKHLISGKVIYSNEGILPRLSGDPFVINFISANDVESCHFAIQDHINIWFSELFLRKLTDWANEDEYRWVCLDSDPNPVYVDFGAALEAIVIGEQVSDVYYDDILRYCVKFHADMAKLTWHNGYSRIEHPGQPYLTHKHLVCDSGVRSTL